MQTTPKSLRLQIGIFGRMNTGKSTFLNMVAGQDVAITSPVPGTTTDVVEKAMELLPIGPVVFLDTAGLDDVSALGDQRLQRTRRALDRSDVVLLVTEAGVWGDGEEALLQEARSRKKPFAIVVNKADVHAPAEEFLVFLRSWTDRVIVVSSIESGKRDDQVRALKQLLIGMCPEDFLRPPSLLGDLVSPGGVVVLVVPIDLEAPKGRLILPQVQAIREALDADAAVVVVKERELSAVLANLKSPPDLVVCDSQVVQKMVADVPPGVKCTTFSILFARFKGDLVELARGGAAIEQLRPGDKVLVAESCSHHAVEDDIGRVKIPRWLRQYIGGDLVVEHSAGRDYPADLSAYRLVVLCGSCMLTRGETLLRLQQAREKGVPVTNYGVAISFVQGVLPRVLEPFPLALEAFEQELKLVRRQLPSGV